MIEKLAINGKLALECARLVHEIAAIDCAMISPKTLDRIKILDARMIEFRSKNSD